MTTLIGKEPKEINRFPRQNFLLHHHRTGKSKHPPSKATSKASSIRSPPLGKSRCYVLRDAELRPGISKAISLRTSECPPQEEYGIVAVSAEFLEKTGSNPALNSLHSLGKEGIMEMPVLNLTNETLTVKRGTYFGLYESLTQEDIDDHPPESIQTISDDTNKSSPTEKEQKKWIIEQFQLRDSPWLKTSPVHFRKVVNLLFQYLSIISKNDEYGKTNLVQHEIKLVEGTRPVSTKCRPINPILETSLKEQMTTGFGTM